MSHGAPDYAEQVSGAEILDGEIEEKHFAPAALTANKADASLGTQAELDALSAVLTQAINDEEAARIAADDAILAQKGAANGIATLGADSKIPTAQMPSIALVDVYGVADIAARDALAVQQGDVAVVADAGSGLSATYMWDGAAWVEVSVGNEVLSVNGQTGVVVLAKGDVGLGNVDDVQQEPAFAKNTAFNKNFGTGAGQVAEGNHTHTTVNGLKSAAGLDTEAAAARSIATGLTSITGYSLTLQSSTLYDVTIRATITGGTINYEVINNSNGVARTDSISVAWTAFGT